MYNNAPVITAKCGIRNWLAQAGNTYSVLHADSHLCTSNTFWLLSLFLIFSACCHNYCCTSLSFITCAWYPTTKCKHQLWHMLFVLTCVSSTDRWSLSPLYVIIGRIWAWWGMENVNYSLCVSWETQAGCKHGRSSDFRALIRSAWSSGEKKKHWRIN